jgi:hypothetical protein
MMVRRDRRERCTFGMVALMISWAVGALSGSWGSETFFSTGVDLVDGLVRLGLGLGAGGLTGLAAW